MAKAEDYGVELAHYLRFFNLSKKSVTISFLLVQTFPSFFCLCKRKKQRKSRADFDAEYFLSQPFPWPKSAPSSCTLTNTFGEISCKAE